jgi:hypothetical protein
MKIDNAVYVGNAFLETRHITHAHRQKGLQNLPTETNKLQQIGLQTGKESSNGIIIVGVS